MHKKLARPVPILRRGDRGGRYFAKRCRRSPSAARLGAARVTLLGDAIHPTTPNLGQGACQGLEDAVVLADSLRRCAPVEAALRDYEARRHHRANFVIGQSRRIGTMVQLTNPMGVWLRELLGSASWAQKRTDRLFERLLCVDLPELAR